MTTPPPSPTSHTEVLQGVTVTGGRVETIIGRQLNYYTVINRPPDRNRAAMLQKVRQIWIDGLLTRSLAAEARIALGLADRPGSLDLTLAAQYQELDQAGPPLPPGASIFDIFAARGGALLILGTPGSGKTTLLLELCQALLTIAERHVTHPIPIVFNLSSWATRHEPLDRWLVAELRLRYDVPRRIAEGWVASDMLLPLLDGLDEVAANQREACVAAINAYRGAHMVPLAVCAREAEYALLTAKLRLGGAIAVQPLRPQQVATVLDAGGDRLAGLRAAIAQDAELGALATSPLILSAMSLAYAGLTTIPAPAATPVERYQRIWDGYITAVFRRRRPVSERVRWRTMGALIELARGLQNHQETLFAVERLQPSWLSSPGARRAYVALDRIGAALLVGLVMPVVMMIVALAGLPIVALYRSYLGTLVPVFVVGALIGACFGGTRRGERGCFSRLAVARDALLGALLIGSYGALLALLGPGTAADPETDVYHQAVAAFGGINANLSTRLSNAAMYVIAFGGLGAIAGGLFGGPAIRARLIKPVERLGWSWRQAGRSALGGLALGGILSCPAVLYARYGGTLQLNTTGSLLFLALVWLAITGFLALFTVPIFGLLGGIQGGRVDAASRPNQPIWRSARAALFGGLCFWLIAGLIAVPGIGWNSSISLPSGEVLQGWPVALRVGLLLATPFGIIGALGLGGFAVLSHLALRLVIWRWGVLPLRLIPFLDVCAERALLWRVGSSYLFAHRLLRDHIAALSNDDIERLVVGPGTR